MEQPQLQPVFPMIKKKLFEHDGDRREAGSSQFGLLGTASTMGLHMVSGPIVGGVFGWLIDKGLDSWPWGAGIGVVLGVAAGFRNVFADARHLAREQEEREQAKRGARHGAEHRAQHGAAREAERETGHPEQAPHDAEKRP